MRHIPETPPGLVGDEIAEEKYRALCADLIAISELTPGNLHAVELAAKSYARWRDAEGIVELNGFDCKEISHAHRYRDSFLNTLASLGLIKAPTKAKPQPGKKRAKPKELRAQSIPKLKIY